MRRRTAKPLWIAVFAAWALCVAIGEWQSARFESEPAPLAPAAPHWPATSAIAPSAERPTLVLFLHPECPCASATLAELERVAAAARERVALHVLMTWDGPEELSWLELPLWQRAAAIPGVHVAADFRGVEARRFAATTSGELYLYSSRRDGGALLFHGGITPARGHEGDSVGKSAVLAALGRGAGITAQCIVTPAFGCPLFGAEERGPERATLAPRGGASR